MIFLKSTTEDSACTPVFLCTLLCMSKKISSKLSWVCITLSHQCGTHSSLNCSSKRRNTEVIKLLPQDHHTNYITRLFSILAKQSSLYPAHSSIQCIVHIYLVIKIIHRVHTYYIAATSCVPYDTATVATRSGYACDHFNKCPVLLKTQIKICISTVLW